MRRFAMDQAEAIVKSIPCAVYAPVEKDALVTYERFEDGMTLRLDVTSPDKSPKDVLFPQWENLMHFRMEGKTIEITEQQRCDEDYVIFGMRACDIKAFEVLDKVFLAEPVDTYYAARRQHGTIVALACGEPVESCFCKNFGVDPANPKADVVMWLVGDEYYCQAYTGKGEALMAAWETQEADEMPVDWAKGEIEKKYDALPFAKLNLNGFDGEHLQELFDSPKWKKLSLACLGCGSCTFSCPTCQCYDIRDYDTGHGVQRYRCWDSCMYSDFTMMAGGQSRPTQLERYRQRFMHKLVYFPANNGGMYSCVGCGRCVRKCPQNLNIVKVIKALGEDEK
ncbi:MAG: 4Fe-4S dicluster domain-containing protein [Eubacteriales bacterium]|nr:4Fe-4S dicluster domain-containing protein [Eubacteriales bacterium]